MSRLLLGILLVAICWPLNWWLDGPRTHLLFFPLWLGYILIVDGWVARRTGSSIWLRSRRGFVLLFLASIPVWWLFELLNLRLQNWHYVGRELFSDLEYAILCSIAFSTVIPAVLETADLWRSFRFFDRFGNRAPRIISRRLSLGWLVAGSLMLAVVLIVPRFAYPLTWMALLFLFEPLAWRLRHRSLFAHLEQGDWRPWIVLPLGSVTCGFLWEMWNYWSYPKWVYDIPFVEFAYLFEMPALGYLGYLPFGLEIYPLTHLLSGRATAVALGWTEPQR